MGTRGPVPTPNQILELRGSNRANRGGETMALDPVAPRRPAWLSKDAGDVWRQVVPLLEAARVLGEVDQCVLATFCVTWSHWRRAVKDVEKFGVTYEAATAHGARRYQNPAVAAELSYAAELRALGDRLGLSPSARARIRPAGEAPAGAAKGPDYFGDRRLA